MRAGVLTSFVERLSPDKNLNVVCDLTLYYILIFGLVYYLRCFSFLMCGPVAWYACRAPDFDRCTLRSGIPFWDLKPVVSNAVCLCRCIRLSCDIACAANICWKW